MDKSTDVLSFPQIDWARPCSVKTTPSKKQAKFDNRPPLTLGDIVISLDNANKNASNLNQGLDREVCFLLVHGILHLCGHDHVDPSGEKLMLKHQRKLMTIIEEYQHKPLWKGCVKHKI